jgi:hypothetical protein
MTDLSWPSDSDSEGKSPGWCHSWEREKTPSSSSSPANDATTDDPDAHDAISDDPEEEEEDEDSRWARLEAEEAAEEASAKREAMA